MDGCVSGCVSMDECMSACVSMDESTLIVVRVIVLVDVSVSVRARTNAWHHHSIPVRCAAWLLAPSFSRSQVAI
jgi:hypothetical protein